MDYNLLISHKWREGFQAKQEIKTLLEKFGDSNPIVEKTTAKGILGVKTSINNREVIAKVRELFKQNPLEINFTLKWVPVDHWCDSDINQMKDIIERIKSDIHPGETWGMDVEKRRFTEMHTQEIIDQLAPLITEKVNLENPNKILRIDILAKRTVITILKPEEIFSVAKG